MRDIEWLKEAIKEYAYANYGNRMKIDISEEELDSLLDQLDEPEVLTQDWIGKNVEYAYFDMLDGSGRLSSATAIIKPKKLKNLLVQNQEITEDQAWSKIAEYYPVEQVGLKNAFEHFYYGGFMTDVVAKKPVIPKFVAEYLDFAKSDTTLMRVLELANTRSEWEKWEKEYDWIEENHELFARAWLDGFTVEKEQKYYVLSKELHPMLCESAGTDKKIMESITELTINEKGLYKEQYALTEQEIKDYDERFWPFAVKVEELEE